MGRRKGQPPFSSEKVIKCGLISHLYGCKKHGYRDPVHLQECEACRVGATFLHYLNEMVTTVSKVANRGSLLVNHYPLDCYSRKYEEDLKDNGKEEKGKGLEIPNLHDQNLYLDLFTTGTTDVKEKIPGMEAFYLRVAESVRIRKEEWNMIVFL